MQLCIKAQRAHTYRVSAISFILSPVERLPNRSARSQPIRDRHDTRTITSLYTYEPVGHRIAYSSQQIVLSFNKITRARCNNDRSENIPSPRPSSRTLYTYSHVKNRTRNIVPKKRRDAMLCNWTRATCLGPSRLDASEASNNHRARTVIGK